MMNNELAAKKEACERTAMDFTRSYYDTFDNRRHQIDDLYIDNAVFSLNGDCVRGREIIGRCLQELPASAHQLYYFHAEPLADSAFNNETTHCIHASGTVKYVGQLNRIFLQTLIIIDEGDNWKIASDSYRLLESIL